MGLACRGCSVRKLLRFVPEIASILIGFAYWFLLNGTLYWNHLYSFDNIDITMGKSQAISFIAAIICAIVYYLTKRPVMWTYLLSFYLSLVLIVPISAPMPPLIFIVFSFASVSVVLRHIFPAVFICLIYHALFSRKFGKPQKSQGGDEP